jgi:hypothetical protein
MLGPVGISQTCAEHVLCVSCVFKIHADGCDGEAGARKDWRQVRDSDIELD